MTKTNKRIIAVLSVVMIIATIICLCLIGVIENNSSNNLATKKSENNFSAEMKNTEYVKLAMSSALVLSSNGSVSKNISATVLPATANNKAVDWSVSWDDESNSQTVTNYVTVIPDSDGSTNATVTCKQAFTGTIIVTVTTKESGYQATCVVTFVGIPSNIDLNGSVSTSTGTITLGIGQDYVFDVGLNNPFNSVGSQFNDVTCSIKGVGSMTLGYYEYYVRSGTSTWYDDSDKTVTLDALKNNFISSNFSNGKLTIKTLKSIESYYSSVRTLDSGRTRAYSDKFRSYVDDCYFELTIKENVSGLSKKYIIRFDDKVVTGVKSGTTEIQF